MDDLAPALIGDTESDEPENFAFVGNIGRLLGSSNLILCPGHVLRRATNQEISIIQATIQRHGNDGELMRIMSPWESRRVGTTMEALPREDWRYFVIAFRGQSYVIEQLAHVFTISPLELSIAFTIMSRGHGVTFHPWRLFNQLHDAKWGFAQFFDVSESDIQEIKTIHYQLEKHPKEQINILRFTRTLQQLDSLRPASPLTFLGFFAVLEGLLTHAPEPKDPLDSITRQITTKVALLDRRFRFPLDFGAFGNTPQKTIWKKMYAYRSCLAHGGIPDFAGELQTLVNDNTALGLLKQTVKAVLRQALIEPELIVDLREC